MVDFITLYNLQSQLLRYLKQLEKDRNSLYNELRDKEWKLDQESKVICHYIQYMNTYTYAYNVYL